MISEGSCDTEDWSNDAENSALHYRNKWYFKIYQIVIIFYSFNYFLSNKYSLGETFLFKKIKHLKV